MLESPNLKTGASLMSPRASRCTGRAGSTLPLLAALCLGACVAVPERDFTLADGGAGGGTGGQAAGGSVALDRDTGTGGSLGDRRDLPSEHPRDLGPGGQGGEGGVPGDAGRPRPTDAVIFAPDAGGGGPRLEPQNAFGPAARVTFLDMPRSRADAAAAGCRIAAHERGSILFGAFNFSGRPLASYVEPDANGHIEVVELARIRDWPASARVSALGEIGFDLFQGRETRDPDTYLIERGGFESRFDAVSVGPDGEFETGAGYTTFILPLVLGGQTIFTMERATVRGRLEVDGPGFAVRDGFVEGYYTRNGLAETIRYLDSICSMAGPPPSCDAFYLLVPHGACAAFGDARLCEDMIDVLASTVGGFDAQLVPGSDGVACDVGECNAVGVCLQVELGGVLISGESP